MKIRFWIFLSLIAIAMASAALAHEHQVFEIGNGRYDFTVGSLNEPIFVDDKSGVDLRINKLLVTTNQSQPQTGLEKTLKVEIAAGGKKKILELSPAFRDPGAYSTSFYPTVPTTYTYRFFGAIEGIPVDILFKCNPVEGGASAQDDSRVAISDKVARIQKRGSFSCPRSKSDSNFPEKVGSLWEIAKNSGQTVQTGSMNMESADDTIYRNLALAGFGISLLGLAVAFIALIRAKKGQN